MPSSAAPKTPFIARVFAAKAVSVDVTVTIPTLSLTETTFAPFASRRLARAVALPPRSASTT